MEEGKLIKEYNEYYLNDDLGVLIASTDKILLKETDTVKKLSLKNCEAVANGYDLDDLADWYGIETEIKSGRKVNDEDFISGFETALQILGDKKFSEEDVISMIEKSRETGLTAEYLILTKQQILDIVLELKAPELTEKLGSIEKIEQHIMKTKFGDIFLN